jgi:hypothetical protein
MKSLTERYYTGDGSKNTVSAISNAFYILDKLKDGVPVNASELLPISYWLVKFTKRKRIGVATQVEYLGRWMSIRPKDIKSVEHYVDGYWFCDSKNNYQLFLQRKGVWK